MMENRFFPEELRRVAANGGNDMGSVPPASRANVGLGSAIVRPAVRPLAAAGRVQLDRAKSSEGAIRTAPSLGVLYRAGYRTV